jgi:hypothetical protein
MSIDHACKIIVDVDDLELDHVDREIRVREAASALVDWVDEALTKLTDDGKPFNATHIAAIVASGMLHQFEHDEKHYASIIAHTTGPKYFISKHAAEMLKEYLDMIVKQDGASEPQPETAPITEVVGDRAEALNALSTAAYEAIKIIELERSGIRDGNGFWNGGDVIGGMTSDLINLSKKLLAADRGAS